MKSGYPERKAPSLVKQSVWAVCDQGLFAGSNFLLNILLARWLSPAEYGAFAIAYSVFLLFGMAHAALIVEPMLVYGSGCYRDAFPEYLRHLLFRGHTGFAVAAGALVLAAAASLNYALPNFSPSVFFGMALALPALLGLWLLRRATYACGKPLLSVFGGASYLLVALTSIFLLHSWLSVSAMNAMLVLGAASLIAGLLIYFSLISRCRAQQALDGREILQRHIRYGRWAIGTGLLAWIPTNIYFILLPAIHGTASVGHLKALFNLIEPVLQATAAMSVLLVPEMVSAQHRGQLSPLVKAALSVFMAGALAYCALIGIWGSKIVLWLYDSSYAPPSLLMWRLGAIPIPFVVRVVLEAAARSLDHPDWVFWANVGSTITTFAIGVPLALRSGAPGAVLGFLFATTAVAICLIVILKRISRTELPERVPAHSH